MIWLAVLALLPAFAGAGQTPVGTSPTRDQAPDFSGWLAQIPSDPGVRDGLAYFTEGSPGPLPAAYVDRLPTVIRDEVTAAAVRAVAGLKAGTCEPFIEVRFPDPGFSGVDPGEGNTVKKFEDSFVRVEMIACFPGAAVGPGEALAMYTDPAFRIEASSRIKEIVEEDGLSCIHTDGVPVLLDPSRACNRVTELVGEDLASQHSQVVSGENGSGFQPTYFKESIKTFVRLSGGVGLHYINYTRSVGLSGLKKRIGRGKAAESQQAQVDLLAARLGVTLPR